MVYATENFYKEKYLLGRKPKIPLQEFMYWEQVARAHIEQFTFKRITEDELSGPNGDIIGNCTCELAEFLYMNEGYENKTSESISGRSVSYKAGTEYQICKRHLGTIGLMYRGSNYG